MGDIETFIQGSSYGVNLNALKFDQSETLLQNSIDNTSICVFERTRKIPNVFMLDPGKTPKDCF